MGSDVVFDNLCLDRCLRSACHLDIVMLLFLGDAFLMVRFVSVVFGLSGSRIWRWTIWWHLTFFWSITHSMPYWDIFPFQIWLYRSSRVCMLIPIRDICAEMMACSLFYDDPSVEPLWDHSARPTTHLMPYWGMFPLLLRFIDLRGVACSSPLTRYAARRWPICYLVMILRRSPFWAVWDHTFDDGWFHVTWFPTYRTFDAILGHIFISDEV